MGWGDGELSFNRCIVSVWENGKFWRLFTQQCGCTKHYEIPHLKVIKMMSFMFICILPQIKIKTKRC
jgi:hypothetical protein